MLIIRNIKPINQIFLRVATEDSRKLKLSSGLELYFDDKFNYNWHRQQIGQIAYLPEKYSTSDNDVPLFIGDIVYFHHLATANVDVNMGGGRFGSQSVHGIEIEGEKLYMQPIDQIFAVKRGDEIICLHDNVFVEQEGETEDDIRTKSGIWTKSAPEILKHHGTVIGLPPCAEEWNFLGPDKKFGHNIKVGSRIQFKKKSEYQINADFGKRLVYKMPLENILIVYN